jgi:hypothetical protein
VLAYSWNGDLLRIIRMLEPMNEVTDAEFEAVVNRVIESVNPAWRSAYERTWRPLEPPGHEPTFQQLIVDSEGWVWARTYQVDADNARPRAAAANAPATWLLFDAEGRGRGSVTMPARLSVESIARDHVAGIWEDELGVEYVRLYRIEGRP